MESLSESMKRRMDEHLHIHARRQRDNPLTTRFMQRAKIGTLLSRPFLKQEIQEKESIFKKRTKNFLYVSFSDWQAEVPLLIAFSPEPLSFKTHNGLKKAADKIAGGDFKARTSTTSHDEIGKLSAAFNKMAESLQERRNSGNIFFSNVAHELRTPLTILKTHAEAIADGVIEREKGLENIKNEIDRLIKLVKGIEDITMAEASFFTKGETVEINLMEFLTGNLQ